MQKHIGDHSPGFPDQHMKISRNCKGQEERRIGIMAIQQKIKYLDQIYQKKDSEVNVYEFGKI